MLLQKHSASLFIENKLTNSIIGSCIALNHLNLFINFLQQPPDFDLGKLYRIPTNNSLTKPLTQAAILSSLFSQGKSDDKNAQQALTLDSKEKSLMKKEHTDIWQWKYTEVKIDKQYLEYPLIYLIIERDWQGALSLILNELDRFRLSSIQILEAAISNNKLNLVLRLLLRIKDKYILHEKNTQDQNLFHLLANMDQYDAVLLEQILSHIHSCNLEWSLPDKYGSHPIHYACVKQNFILINFLRQKYTIEFNLNQTDGFKNTPIGLLFWRMGAEKSFKNTEIRSLITSSKQLDCLCNYDNEIAMNPLSFGHINSSLETNFYPPEKSEHGSTNVRTSPLINAVVHNNFELVKFLLQLDVDVNFPDEEKRTPLMHAVLQVNLFIKI